MKIRDLLDINSIDLNGPQASKNTLIHHMANLFEGSGVLDDKDAYVKAVLEREASGTTGIGDGVAIPHGKSKGVIKPGLSAMVIKEGIDFESLDGEDSKLFFMIAVPENSNDQHLKVLSHLSVLLMDESFRNDLIKAETREEFLSIIDKKESEDKKNIEKNKSYDFVAVTSCPTGIAHTYMAAEALERAAENLGYKIKVETNGSVGVENVLSEEDIKRSKGVIIAADTNIDKKRFHGKRIIDTSVSKGIHQAENLIKTLADKEAKIYTEKEKQDDMVDVDIDKKGHKFYQHLMNGVSHMLPFVIGGGILIALAFLFDDYNINPDNFGSNTPLAAMFNEIGGTAFSFMLPVLSGFIAMSIADRPGLAVGFVGGALASLGEAGFLGALLAGFISGYIIELLKRIFSKLPKSLSGIKPILLYPLFGILLIGIVMTLMVNPPLKVLNSKITDLLDNLGSGSKVFLGFILAGMMAVDMGGPINKAAYVFGTASLVEGSSEIMAAVMIGGMIPPLAIAFASYIFKNKFTQKDRESGIANIIMGLSFITEGAIPFAAADPLHVIPPLVLGSGVAGALSMVFGSSLRAPHGGLWVIGVIENPIGFIISLVLGTIVGTIALGSMKKSIR